MSTSPDFWNKLAQKYAAQPIDDEAAYRRKLEITQGYLTPQMELLEFGCGTGGTSVIHAPHVKSIHAIDYAEEMIAFARKRASEAGVSNVTFEVQSINTLDEPEASYDAILGLSILHLLPNRLEVMDKVYNLLKPGGYFFSSTACIKDMNPLVPFVLPIMRAFGKAPFVGVFNAEELVTELEQKGFSIIEQWRPRKSSALFVVARKN